MTHADAVAARWTRAARDAYVLSGPLLARAMGPARAAGSSASAPPGKSAAARRKEAGKLR
jgi:hypothetical protein